MNNDYKKVNKAAWNLKTNLHINSEFYNNESFLKGELSLKHIELDLLEDINGNTHIEELKTLFQNIV